MTDYSSEEFWKGAPEGATHWEPASGLVNASWMKLSGSQWYYWPPRSDAPAWVFTLMRRPERVDRMVARPTTPQWNGTGLPPAGTECEYFAKTEQRWIPVVMIGVFRNTPVLGCIETGVVGQLDLECYQLRPRRTPAQIAADEREAAIDEMAGWAGATGLPVDRERKILGRLYDGGYRKQEKQE